MADLRGLPLTSGVALEAAFRDPIPNGFSASRSYTVLCMAVDCQPTPPKLYVLIVDDSQALAYVTADTVLIKSLTPR
jgi:hypothetical protein